MAGALPACTTMGTDDSAASPIDDSTTPPPATPPAATTTPTPTTATITIKTVEPFRLVAYREVTDPVWHTATEVTSGLFTARVAGPYWVTAVCQSEQLGSAVLFTQVWRAGRTLDDDHEVQPPFLCAPAAAQPLPEVTGNFAQANAESATVALSGNPNFNASTQSTQEFPFSILVPDGTYSMYGFNSERIVIRPDVVVSRSLPVFPFDLTLDGAAYVPATLVVANADPNAFVHAVTRIEDANGTFPFALVDVPLPGEVVPNAAMTTDNQTVSVQAQLFTNAANVSRNESLASRRPWRLGDDPTFVEPPQITSAAWAFDGFGQLFASWQALPPTPTDVTNEVRGLTASGGFVDDFTDMSPAFLTATNPTRVDVDTTIPGFEPDWIIDYHSAFASYTRKLVSQSVSNTTAPEQGQVSTSEVTETVFPAGQIASRAAADALPEQPHLPRQPGFEPIAR